MSLSACSVNLLRPVLTHWLLNWGGRSRPPIFDLSNYSSAYMTKPMHSLGCFGSILAHDVTSSACSTCQVETECAAKVQNRQPTILKFLSHFADGQGNSVAASWQKRTEKKPKRSETNNPIIIPGAVQDLKKRVDNRLHRAIDNAAEAGIDLFTCPTEDLGVTKSASLVVHELSSGARPIAHLIDTLVQRYSSTQATARRNVYAVRSLLIETKRARQTGQILEMI